MEDDGGPLIQLYEKGGVPPEAVAVSTTLLPAQVVATLLASAMLAAGGWEMVNTLCTLHAVKASVTVTLHCPALRLVVVTLV